MYKNGKILIGKNEDKEVNILLNMANRHGLITGATGTGKTVTMKVMAESFSSAGVPVFMVDVKGDIAGTAYIGEENENVKSRVEKMKLEDFKFAKFPAVFLDVYGESGHPIRTTPDAVGHRLLSKMLGLSEVQDSVLAIIFKIAHDEGKTIDNLDDLESMLVYVNNNRNEYVLKYGNIASQSITTIQRNVIELHEELKGYFFNKPIFDIKDFRGVDVDTGYGRINILDAQKLFQHPDSYVAMVLWLLNSLYENMPEVGDLDKPKLVFFFDEAHLLFSDMPKAIVDHVIKVVKLIRSKGVGVYFVSQNPTDIPNEILSQLGCKIQHALHAYTPLEQKGIKAAAESFRVNPAFDTAEAIQNLGTGEALVSVLDEKGEPSMVEKVKILPPQSRMGTITEEERRSIINNSPLADKYDEVVDDESAKEANDVVFKEQAEAKAEAERIKEEEKQAKEEAKIKKEEERIAAKEQREKEKAEREAERAKKNSVGYKLGKKVANKTADKLINKGLNSIFKGLFK